MNYDEMLSKSEVYRYRTLGYHINQHRCWLVTTVPDIAASHPFLNYRVFQFFSLTDKAETHEQDNSGVLLNVSLPDIVFYQSIENDVIATTGLVKLYKGDRSVDQLHFRWFCKVLHLTLSLQNLNYMMFPLHLSQKLTLTNKFNLRFEKDKHILRSGR